MVTKNQIKLVNSLQQKKYRSQHGLFVVEGKKTTTELLQAGLTPYKIYVGEASLMPDRAALEVVSDRDLRAMSGQKTPSGIIGVFYMPKPKEIMETEWVLALDAVRDPGNLGTIIRLCDWFDIPQLVCSSDTADCYNPKVLQATMGSVARVNIIYTDLKEYLESTVLPVYGAFMDGERVYGKEIPNKGVLVMGNEASGISREIEAKIVERIAIPQFGNRSAESLNVATATAILLNEIRRGT